jgi:hypothetical protein
MEQAEEWTSKKKKPEAQEQTHGASRSKEQAGAWSKQKHGASRSME